MDGLVEYFCTLNWYVQTMLKIVNRDPQVTTTHTKDCAETLVHVQSSLTIKGTSCRKAESAGT